VIIFAQSSRSSVEEAVWKADAESAEATFNNVDKMLAFYDPNAVFFGTNRPTSGSDRLRALPAK
jgi:hypothetical protein